MEENQTVTIAALIHRLAAWQTAYMNQYLHDLSLNNDQANVIRFVNGHPGTNQQAIANLLSRNGASVTNLVKRLEQDSLLERRYLDGDERTKHLFLTTHGQAVNEQIDHGFTQLNRLVNEALTETQQTTTLTGLTQLADTLLHH